MSTLNSKLDEVDGKKLLEGIKKLSEKDVIVSAVLNLVELEIKASYLENADILPTERYVEDIIIKNELHRISLLTIGVLSNKVSDLKEQINYYQQLTKNWNLGD